jgi:hypothetical protein
MCNPEVKRTRCWGSSFPKLVFQQPARSLKGRLHFRLRAWTAAPFPCLQCRWTEPSWFVAALDLDHSIEIEKILFFLKTAASLYGHGASIKTRNNTGRLPRILQLASWSCFYK